MNPPDRKVEAMDPVQEARWLEQARAGDVEAFCRLVEAYQRPVYNLAYRMLGNPEEAEDATQETFLRAFTRLHQYDPTRKFSTWILSIANHHCIDRLRRRRMTWVSMDDAPQIWQMESQLPRPEEALMDQETAAEMQALLQELEPEYRTPLILRYWYDLSYQEIAEVMDLTLAAVKTRLFRARQKLADVYLRRAQATEPAPITGSPSAS